MFVNSITHLAYCINLYKEINMAGENKQQSMFDLFKIKKRQGAFRYAVQKTTKKMLCPKIRQQSVKVKTNIIPVDHDYTCTFTEKTANDLNNCGLNVDFAMNGVVDADSVTRNWLQYEDDDISQNNENDYGSIDWTETRRKFRKELSQWSVLNQINRNQLKELLKLCNNTLPFRLPTDPRTIMATPTSITVHTFDDNSNYWHHGIKTSLLTQLRTISKLPDQLSLNINIDGLPLYESSREQFWPILFNISELHQIEPMIIGIYCGKSE